jgi:aspartate--ammonia ligase
VRVLPPKIHFLTTQELEDAYPSLTSKEREHEITKEYGAVFLMQVGKRLTSGKRHDDRAPDYDDWELNGDILVWNPVLNTSLELSSMGIRVDRDSLLSQLEELGREDKLQYQYSKDIVDGKLPFTIGGGIG